MSQTKTAVRRAGALVAIAAASGLVVVLVPTVMGTNQGVMTLHPIFLTGCAAVLFSPAHRAVTELARRAAEAARAVFGAPATELGTALFSLPTDAGATWQAEAAMRRTGALVALAAASVLVLMLFPAVQDLQHGVMAAYAAFLLGCAAVLLSPLHRAVAELVRLAAEDAREIRGASARTNAWLRWTGFTCILFCASSAAGNVWAADNCNGVLLLFLSFLVGVWAVSLSMVTAKHPPPLPLWPCLRPAAEEGRDGGVVNAVPQATRGVAASEVWNILH